jgi:hypothetical protein
MWTKDGLHIQRLLFAGTSLDWARALSAAFARKRPRGRLTVRQRARVLAEWPKKSARSDAVTDAVKRGLRVYAIGAGQPRAWVPGSHFGRSSSRTILVVSGT